MTRMTPQELRHVVAALGLTQRDVANAVGVPLRTFTNWLTGTNVPPSSAAIVLRLMAKGNLSVRRALREQGEAYAPL